MSNSKFVRSCNPKDVEIPKRFPTFEKPSVTGCFSLDTLRCYHGDTSQLKYINVPTQSHSVNWDLNVKFDERIKKNDDDEKIDNLLKWILEHKSSLDRTQADVVCYRGLLTQIMCTPYEKSEGWIINATKWNGVIYLCEAPTEHKLQRKLHLSSHEERCQAWGYKFEQYMASENPGMEPNASEPCNEREEFCVIFRTKLNEHKILYGAEVDGINSSCLVNDLEDLTEATFVELKTSKLLQQPRHHSNFRRYKLLKWWCQSFLVGIRTIVCGFRDDSGIVRELEVINVGEVHKEAKFQGEWDPLICMSFCDAFFTLVRSVVEEDSPDTVFRFEWEPFKNIEYTKISGPSEFSFLRKWYTDEMSRELRNREQRSRDRVNREQTNRDRTNKEKTNRNRMNKEEINQDRMNKEPVNRNQMNKELMNRDRINKEQMNRDRMNRDQMKKNRVNKEQVKREHGHKERMNKEQKKRH